MHDARAELAAANSLLELAVAAGIDDGDHVEPGVGDLIQVAVEEASAVARAQDCVASRGTAAGAGARQLHVLADSRE